MWLGLRGPRRWATLICVGIAATLASMLVVFASQREPTRAALRLPSFFSHDEVKEPSNSSPSPAVPQLPADSNHFDEKHPIGRLSRDAEDRFQKYDVGRSKTFKETVQKYRLAYGRHPPPGFKEWYKFARENKVYDIDDFQQINDDLRPFWATPPAEIRRYAANAAEDSVGLVSIRKHNVLWEHRGWRPETFAKMLEGISKFLPDMDIPINHMDQPRVVVPWDDLQRMLSVEESTRSLNSTDVHDRFTTGMSYIPVVAGQDPDVNWLSRLNPLATPKAADSDTDESRPDYDWFNYAGKHYMDLAAEACPPESYARNPASSEHRAKAEASYKSTSSGFVQNFNLSSDLCTVGPYVNETHGMLYASSSMLASRKLIPIFSECKLNVNNDILFPANMYWTHDPRYMYDEKNDVDWEQKKDIVIWRGITSGGTAILEDPEGWQRMHRQRLVLMLNATNAGDREFSIFSLPGDDLNGNAEYDAHNTSLTTFLKEHADVGFTEKMACIPNCDFYDSVFEMLKGISFTETFQSKYLVDVDGHSFSGRWRAFLQSKSMGIKATIFREWHDSRMWAWRHFVPMDNRYDDLYSILTYFIGIQSSKADGNGAYVPRHDDQAHHIAEQGRQWAGKVLRDVDIQIYLLRLLLEYARIIDDNRDKIGIADDGGLSMENFDRGEPAVA
ncbi:Beta-1,2-xylosyltransferase 1, protein [Acrodontium crateriforme]|uniref:Beta-1,2-xylosyltransferase 1, protein n=1 Tax=Acrodontium crateriforme TaxID=150365 RepID=A0AAQ3MBV2_9PEZI|nr:Beta-1,2-xylosyltransferase 1, protein [Acrodontium crateriforme]